MSLLALIQPSEFSDFDPSMCFQTYLSINTKAKARIPLVAVPLTSSRPRNVVLAGRLEGVLLQLLNLLRKLVSGDDMMINSFERMKWFLKLQGFSNLSLCNIKIIGTRNNFHRKY